MFRSVLTVGVAAVTATAVAFGPSIQEPMPAAPPAPVVAVRSAPVDLAAQVRPLAVAELPNLLIGWVERFIVPPSASQAFPAPPSGPAPAPQSLTGSLEWAYHAIEPWVQYGFELATYAVGWIPWVGWLSGQIMIFYHFGESIVHAIAHNTLDWLAGNGSFLQNVGDGIAWTIDAFIQLGIDQWNFWLPSLPPLPPFPLAAAAATTTTEDATTLAVAATTQPREKQDGVEGEDVVAVTDETTVNETTVNETKEPKAPKELKAPKEPEEPKGPKSSTDVAAGAEDSSESNDNSSSPKKASTTEKKKGPRGGTESSTSPKTKDTTDKGGKKKDSNKKDSNKKDSDKKDDQ
ncbi:hypothetical protein [Mycobacterium sp. ACS1612]|uniref:hypothetical protein n=1 Tax=Mycobacterium sp. ACS1612 TaxID=1834117 RepID=UPI0012E99D1B|nr:hypothetical protein [Mycobacterium sp. ACS1612]